MAVKYNPKAVNKYKAKTYKAVKVDLKREIVEAFEEKLKADGIPKAEFIRNAILKYLDS